MGKLQAYFDYFNKYHNVEHSEWYKSLSSWIDIVQKIKSNIADDTNIRQKTEEEIDDFIKIHSDNKLSSIRDFFDNLLFFKDVGIGNIGQGAIYIKHKKIINNNIDKVFLIELLQEPDINKAEQKIKGIISGKNYEAATFRLLRVLFPENFAAVDAPNKLNRLINQIKHKLAISIEGNNIEKHKRLMSLINSPDLAKKQIFYWELYYMLDNILNLKKAIIYYGAPGTGKTFKAKKIAKQFIDEHRLKIEKSNNEHYKIQTVQFHPSYSYEDFIEGIRPSNEKTLKLYNGVFKDFCKKVGNKEISLYQDIDFINNEEFKKVNYNFGVINISDLNSHQKNILEISSSIPESLTIQEVIEPAFFIIDEINRAELSRVLGELMLSLEYRGYTGKIKTQYSYLNKKETDESVFFWENSEDWFFIPQNLYIIGTMNNIDRSVDSFDFALRRRFVWEEIEPNFNIVRNLLVADWSDQLASAFEVLNISIENEELLGKDYRIGHSYALEIIPIKEKIDSLYDVKKFLWNNNIKSLLEEYLRGLGDGKKSQEKLGQFKEKFGIK